MTLIAFFLVLGSASLHAGWNLLSKLNNPSAAFYLLSSSTAAVLCLQNLGSKRTALPRGAAMHHDVVDFSHKIS